MCPATVWRWTRVVRANKNLLPLFSSKPGPEEARGAARLQVVDASPVLSGCVGTATVVSDAAAVVVAAAVATTKAAAAAVVVVVCRACQAHAACRGPGLQSRAAEETTLQQITVEAAGARSLAPF